MSPGYIFLWMLLGVSLAASKNDEGGCPSSCRCPVVGITQRVAICSGFNASQKFDRSIGKLIIENVVGLSLDNHIFSLVGLEKVQSIIITSSTFQKIGPKAFANLENLSYLELEGNNRMVLHPDMFNTTSLLHVRIRQSKLTFSEQKKYLFDIPTLSEIELVNADVAQYLNVNSFSKMPLLQAVNLASNMIKHIDPMFNNLEDLESVNLSDNLIDEIHPDIFSNTNLDILTVHKNPLTSIKGLNVPKLTELDLSMCKFNKISTDMLAGIPMITRLNMSGNAISEIESDAFSNLEDLIAIDLSNNALKGSVIPELFASNKGIQIMSFAHNPSLKALPANMFHGLEELFKLDLSYCGLMELKDEQFKGLKRLINLNLAGNNLQALTPNMLDIAIVILDLSHNNITDVSKIQFLNESRLQTLSLANNKLKEISTNHLKNLQYLRKLDLTSCDLRELWTNNDGTKSAVLKSLMSLLVAKNNIQEILPKQLQLTPHLRIIDLTENNFVCDPGFYASLKWFKSHDVEPINEPVEDLPKDVQPDHPYGNEDVKPGHPYGNDGLQSYNKMDTINAERIEPSSWDVVEMQVCGFDRKEPLEPIGKDDDVDNVLDEDSDEDEEDEEDEDEDNFDEDKMERIHAMDILHSMPVEERFNDMSNYVWPIVIITISGVAILLSLSVLSIFVLRWYRQKNSYGAAMLKHHLGTPRMKRDRSSIYQQLHEEMNSPTTPVMSIKLPGSGKPGYITCAKDDNPYTRNGPQSV